MPFICVIDTVCDGLVASWKFEDGTPVVFATREEAEEEANDVMPDDEPDTVLEVVVTESEIYDPVDGRIYWREM